MRFPDSLIKYSYLTYLNVNNKLSVSKMSDIVLNFVLKSKNGRLILKRVCNGKSTLFIPEQNDIPNCFLGHIWGYTTIEDKIKIIDKYLDYFFEGKIVSKPRLRILVDNDNGIDDSCDASYRQDINEIFVNLDSLSKSDGIRTLSCLYHECSHAIDLNNAKEKLMPNLIEKFCGKKVEYDNIYNFSRVLIDLDTSGYLKSADGKDCPITPILKKDILRCKNNYSSFNIVKIRNVKEIKDEAGFKDYLDSIMYYYQPVERFARVSVVQFFRNQFDPKEVYFSSDKYNIEREINAEKKIDHKIDEFKSFLEKHNLDGRKTNIIDMRDLLDLAMKHRYYNELSWTQPIREVYPKQAQAVKNEYSSVVRNIYQNFLDIRYKGLEKE